jgi:hypothetical protein
MSVTWRWALIISGAALTGASLVVLDVGRQHSVCDAAFADTFVAGEPARTNIGVFDRHVGRVRMVTKDGAAFSPTFSPDGHRIAFTDGRDAPYDEDVGPTTTAIYVVDVDGGHERKVTPGDDREPAWSPDGDAVAYLHSGSQHEELWTVDLSSGQRRRVAQADRAVLPRWQPNGTLGFISEHGLQEQLVLPHGSQPLVESVWPPIWNPTGAVYAAVPTSHGAIQIVDVGTGRATAVNGSTSAASQPLGWLSDGDLIFRTTNGTHSALLASHDGTGAPRLIGHPPAHANVFDTVVNPACTP